jgi:hypothetical protein
MLESWSWLQGRLLSHAGNARAKSGSDELGLGCSPLFRPLTITSDSILHSRQCAPFRLYVLAMMVIAHLSRRATAGNRVPQQHHHDTVSGRD